MIWALVGFMGAGKTTVGRLLSERLGVAFADADADIEAAAGCSITAIFANEGEEGFRLRERAAIERLLDERPGVLALGGGALRSPLTERLRGAATVAWLDLEVDEAWERVQVSQSTRPLAQDRDAFFALHAGRRGIYAAAADVMVDAGQPPAIVADAILAAPRVRPGALASVPALVTDRRALWIVDDAVSSLVPGTGRDMLVVPGGERVKSPAQLEQLWRGLAAASLERRDVVVAVGGGAVTDVAGFAAATFRRGLAWIAVPTTLVGQVDAAIGGKTAIDVAAKNDVGAFHLPETIVADPAVLGSLPPREWAAGFAEVVKTALLAGGRLQDLVDAREPGIGSVDDRTDLIRLTAAYKARIVAEDPREAGVRAFLNLGHTIGHGVEAAAGYGSLLHGEAVAIGLSAALWLSVQLRGLDPAVLDATEALLVRHDLPIRAAGVDADQVLAAMVGDKKRSGGRPHFVLLDAVGAPARGIDTRDELIGRAVARAVDSRP